MIRKIKTYYYGWVKPYIVCLGNRLHKLIFGYTNDEISNLDITILRYISGKLKLFYTRTVYCPDGYEDLYEWRREIHNTYVLIDKLIKYAFNKGEYMKYKHRTKTGCIFAYNRDYAIVRGWLNENLNKLWY